MAERRMFAKTIIDSDAFLDMPLSSQALYFHLSMRADDDGFVNNPKKIQRVIGAADDDLKLLAAKRFVIPFDTGVCVIKHWRIHNFIRSDRYKETVYQEEKSQLTTKGNKAYTLRQDDEIPTVPTDGIPGDIPLGVIRETQVRLGKDRLELGEDSIGYLPEAEAAPAQPPPPPIESGKKGRKKAEIVQPPADYSSTGFSSDMISTIENWLKYKAERRDAYQPTGLQSLITQIKNNVQKHGEQAVISLIQECMAANYKGIIFEKLEKATKAQQYQGRAGNGTGFKTSNPFMEMRNERSGNG